MLARRSSSRRRDAAARRTTAPATTAAAPPVANLRIIFPEGLNVREMGDRVAAVRKIAIAKRKRDAAADARALSRRGLAGATAEAVPARTGSAARWRASSSRRCTSSPSTRRGTSSSPTSSTAFRKNFARVNLSYAKSKNLTPYDVLKIASMIEKETVAPRERKLVAAVIYNRLRNKMPLGIDATLRYGLNIPGTKSLTKAAIGSDNPYNSRRFPGLPPTPVANPGLASIKAAAHPAAVDYLYYVRIPGTKRHFFTASESEFLRKVCEFGYACN